MSLDGPTQNVLNLLPIIKMVTPFLDKYHKIATMMRKITNVHILG